MQFWTRILHTQVRREQKLLGFNGFDLCSKVSLPPLYKPGNIIMHFIWEWFWVHMAFLIPLSHLLLASDVLILSHNSHISLPVQKSTAGNQDVEKDKNSLRGEFFIQSTDYVGRLLQSHSNCSARFWLPPNPTLYPSYRLSLSPSTLRWKSSEGRFILAA